MREKASRPQCGFGSAMKPEPGIAWEAGCLYGRGALRGALGSLKGHPKRTIWRTQGLGSTWRPAGLTAQPTLIVLGSRAASPAGFGAFALLDGPGLTQFRVQG